MKELYKISFLPNEFNCFFHLNSKKLKEFSSLRLFGNCIKVEFVTDLSFFTYSFLSGRHCTRLSDNEIGVSATYAKSLGLKEEDEVLISGKNAMSLTRVEVIPPNKSDYELVIKYFSYLERIILNQVKIVAIGQTIPIHLQSNIIICLKVESLKPEAEFGELQQCTEFVVADPPEIPKIDFVTPHIISELGAEKGTGQVNFFDFISTSDRASAKMETSSGDRSPGNFTFMNKFIRFFKQFWMGDNSRESAGDSTDNFIQNFYSNKVDSVYRVNTGLLIEKEFPASLREKCIIVKRLPVSRTVDGPCSFKIFCKVSKVDRSRRSQLYDQGFDYFTYAYVVKPSVYEDEASKDVYCPEFLLSALTLHVGSYVNIEEVKREEDYLDENRCNRLIAAKVNLANRDTLTEEMKEIFGNTIDTVLNNVRFNQKINTLIVGGEGAGKSYLLNSMMKHLECKSFFCKKLDCKQVSRMKLTALASLFSVSLSHCCNHQPSIFFIDDLDALVIVEEDESQFKGIYSERIGSVLTSILYSYQKLNEISIVATIKSLSNFGSMSTDRGPKIFDNIYEISDLDVVGKKHVLKNLISERYPDSTENTDLTDSLIDYITTKTRGYTIQDLHDLVEMAAFKSLARNKSEICELDKIDFDSALSEKVPLSLYGVNLSKYPRTNWNDIGGLEEPKRLLKEMFEWPIKYRELYQSCPLRLQCGALLYGPPGTGKTLLASAVANECGLNFISVKGPEIFSKYIGASEEGIRDLFLRAKNAKPCLLFFDEFDSLAPRRGSSSEDVNDRVVNQILTELDGVEELKEVFVLAATSRPDILDPALLRPGRIDKAIHFDLPGKEERLSILKALSKSLPFANDVNLEEIASRTEGYTGADLQAVLYAAQTALVKEMNKKYTSANDRVLIITRSHLQTGLTQTKPSISKMEKFKYQSIYENFISSRMGAVLDPTQEPSQQIMFS